MGDHDTVGAAAAFAARWPALTGSDKQTEWAATIRADKIRALDTDRKVPPADRARYRAILLRQTDAGVWIDNRRNPWQADMFGVLTPDERATLSAEEALF
ncbi:MAG: hypothetical protein J2P18_21620 [Nocardia sp.]|nr:hypothetical protein [Nocardia sp.]